MNKFLVLTALLVLGIGGLLVAQVDVGEYEITFTFQKVQDPQHPDPYDAAQGDIWVYAELPDGRQDNVLYSDINIMMQAEGYSAIYPAEFTYRFPADTRVDIRAKVMKVTSTASVPSNSYEWVHFGSYPGGMLICWPDYRFKQGSLFFLFVNVVIKPVKFNLFFWDMDGQNIPQLDEKQKILTNLEKVRVEASKGYNDFTSYRWECSVDGGSVWEPLPQFDNKQCLLFSGNDIPGIFGRAVENKKDILLRINTCEIQSASLTLTPQFYAPKIVSVEPIAPKCKGDANGKLRVTFDRVLADKEKLKILCRGKVPFSVPANTTVVEYPGFSATPGASPADTIRLENSYGGVDAYDEDPVFHQRTFRIPEATEVKAGNPVVSGVSCYGGADGKIQLSGSGGSSGSYTPEYFNGTGWQKGGGGQVAGLFPGTYRLRVVDAYGCLSSEVIASVGSPAKAVSMDVSSVSLTGFGTADGEITLKASGGNGGYAYTLLSGSTPVVGSGGVFRGLSAGTYLARATDKKYSGASVGHQTGCLSEATIQLAQPALLKITSFEVTHEISCSGYSDGELTLQGEGGVGHYTYYWEYFDGGSWRGLNGGGNVRSGLLAGKYRARIKDANGVYSAYVEKTLSGPKPLALSPVAVHPLCYGGNDGVARVEVTGGTGAYSYLWGDGQTVPEVKGLKKGKYTVTVKDINGCSQEIFVLLREPEELFLEGRTTLPSLFGGADGEIVVDVEGGTPPYTYSWKGFAATTDRLTGILAGIDPYVVKVIDVNGCKAELEQVLLNPVDIAFIVKDSVSCHGRTDGALTSYVRGGVGAPYNFVWKKQVSDENYALVGWDSVLNDVGSGAYRLTATDRIGTEMTLDFFFTGPDSLLADLILIPPACKSYKDGSMEAIGRGGTAPYTYSWSNDITAGKIMELRSGRYSVEVKDKRGCVFRTGAFLPEPDSLIVLHSLTIPSAYDASDGSVLLMPQGGTAPYSCLWDYEARTENPLLRVPARDEPYRAVVSDAHGCRAASSPRLLYPITASVAIKDSVFCVGYSNGVLVARVVGGVGKTYRYRWFRLDGERYEDMHVNDSLLTGVGAGVYGLKAYDRENSEAVAVDLQLGTPPLLEVAFSSRDLLCKFDTDGSARALPSGGTPPYSYEWKGGERTREINRLKEAEYRVRVTDDRGCIADGTIAIKAPDELKLTGHIREPLAWHYADGAVWVVPQGGSLPYSYHWTGRTETIEKIDKIPSGEYTVTVKDANGCAKDIVVKLTEPPLLRCWITEGNVVSCKGRSDARLVARAEGGVAQYTYKWYKKNENDWKEVQTGLAADGVSVGVFRLKVTDGNGISVWSDDFVLKEPETLVARVEANSITCNGLLDGRVKAVVEGGTSPYKYLWSTNGTSPELSGITDGRYMVLVTDERGCQVMALGEVTVPDGLRVGVDLVQPHCHGYSDGAIRLSVSGGIQPYRYQWENGSDGLDRENCPGGIYTFKVTDAKGCFRIEKYELSDPAPVLVELGEDRTLCEGQELELDASGGNLLSACRWYRDGNFFDTSFNVSITGRGAYRVEVVDLRGCSGEGKINIARSSDNVTVNFAMAATVEPGEELRLVNTTYPAPRRVEWLLPSDGKADVIRQDEEGMDIVFTDPGTYRLGLCAWKGECRNTLYKTVRVGGKTSMEGNTPQNQPHVKEFTLWPNPSNGRFSVAVRLREESSIRLLLLNTLGQKIDERTYDGSDEFEVPYNLPLRPGIYIMQLLTGKSRETFKILVE